MKNIKKILLVCTGNSCRSIMAEGYLSKRLGEMNAEDILVVSSGTGALPGLKPTEDAIKVMKEHDIDISGHTSSSLNKTRIENADIILVMEPIHKERIEYMVPAAKDKTYLLREFSEEKNKKDNFIVDPMGQSIDFYRETFDVIKSSIEGFLKWLNE